jgi:hypothetical protein
MNEKRNGNFLLFLGILGITGLAIWAFTRSRTEEAEPVTYTPYYPPIAPHFKLNIEAPKFKQKIEDVPVPASHTEEVSHVEESKTTYNNTEEITFPDGFDPDTLMPRKIVVHRIAIVSK